MVDVTQFGKVAVLMGGRSEERAISLQSGQAVLSALKAQGVHVHAFDPAEQAISELAGYDRAFICLHGRYGEDGTIQGALELMDIPYTGSGVMASAIAMDKWRTKILWQAMHVTTPDYAIINEKTDLLHTANTLGLPLFVKPANEGSSIGISKVKAVSEFAEAYLLAAKADPVVIAEQFVGGGEYTVGIIGEKVLPIVQIIPKNEYYDYDAKYVSDETEYRCPAGLSEAQEKQIQHEALQAFKALGCTGWGRVDFLMDALGEQHYFLEVNTSPGMTSHSLVPMAAKATGMTFESLVIEILSLTLTNNATQQASDDVAST